MSNAFKLDKVVNADLDQYTGEPKDEVKITLGDKDKSEFIPDIELKRWNEVSFKIKPRLSAVLSKDKSLSFEGEKIKFDTPKISFEMQDYTEGEGGFKYIWYLNKKPIGNKVEFDIETSGLDFFYQPPLTQEYQNGYSEEFQKEIVVSETQVKDLDGNVLVERPENVVGSYAVYHSTKGGMNDINGKDYKVGKAFHIFRPHIIDATGAETWGILHIENGIYSVEIPQGFLDKAVYPVKNNDTFGITTIGATSGNRENYYYAAANATTNVAGGTMSKIQIATFDAGGDSHIKLAIYDTTPSALIANSYSGILTVTRTTAPTQDSEWISNTSVSATLVGSTNYWLVYCSEDSSVKICYDTGAPSGTGKWYSAAGVYSAFPPNPNTYSLTNSTSKWSIYATYTPSGGSASVSPSISPSESPSESPSASGPPYEAVLKRWTGAEWLEATMKTYLDGSWQIKTLKYWR